MATALTTSPTDSHPASQRERPSLPSFSKPLGVEETRLAISALLRSKSDPNEERISTISQKASTAITTPKPLKRSKKQVSSFYRSALREHGELQTVLRQPATSPIRRPSDAEPQPLYPKNNNNASGLNRRPRSTDPSSSQQQPGVVMIAEPAIHPNSTMYRAAYS